MPVGHSWAQRAMRRVALGYDDGPRKRAGQDGPPSCCKPIIPLDVRFQCKSRLQLASSRELVFFEEGKADHGLQVVDYWPSALRETSGLLWRHPAFPPDASSDWR